MPIRDELTVLPPADLQATGGLRILRDWLHVEQDRDTDDVSESSASLVLEIPAPPRVPTLVGPDGAEYVLPGEIVEALREVVSTMAEGNAVTISPIRQQLTTQEVADFLQMRRPALIELLDSGEIPCQHVGRHRRVRLIDALDYRRVRSERRREALDELVSISDSAGMYESTTTPQATL